jgi:hypothetical protein
MNIVGQFVQAKTIKNGTVADWARNKADGGTFIV